MSWIKTISLSLVAVAASASAWIFSTQAPTTNTGSVASTHGGTPTSIAANSNICTEETKDDVTFVSCGGFF